jgi:hypothetical protein
MKISGFTIIKNAVINGYPIVQAITSILPMVDEMIVLIGDCSDDTENLIKQIHSDKIKIHHSVWDASLKKGGEVLAVETNKAFDLVAPSSTWAFYIQADEVIHEKFHETILSGCKQYADHLAIEGLLFKYLHFYGTYDYVGDSRKWYDHEVRIIRNNKKIRAYRDAQGFRKENTKLLVKPINAYVYHYGWVKEPSAMMKKLSEAGQYWQEDSPSIAAPVQPDIFDFKDFDSITRFNGDHPNVMKQLVDSANWKIDLNESKKKFSFTERLLYMFEKSTGIRLFSYKNYRFK